MGTSLEALLAPSRADSFVADRPLADDLAFGMDAIAAELGIPVRKAYYICAKVGLDGVFKQGKEWIGVKSIMRTAIRAKAMKRGSSISEAAS
jgi:hypothetical protein